MPAGTTPSPEARQVFGIGDHAIAGHRDALLPQRFVHHRDHRVKQRRAMPRRPHHAIAAGMLGIGRVEAQRPAQQHRHDLLGLRRGPARMPRLRRIHRRERQSRVQTAQLGDLRFVDFRQRFERKAHQVQIGAAFGQFRRSGSRAWSAAMSRRFSGLAATGIEYLPRGRGAIGILYPFIRICVEGFYA